MLEGVYRTRAVKEDPFVAQREAEAAKAQRLAMEADKIRMEHELEETAKQRDYEREMKRLEAQHKALLADQRSALREPQQREDTAEVPRSVYLAQNLHIPDIDLRGDPSDAAQPKRVSSHTDGLTPLSGAAHWWVPSHCGALAGGSATILFSSTSRCSTEKHRAQVACPNSYRDTTKWRG